MGDWRSFRGECHARLADRFIVGLLIASVTILIVFFVASALNRSSNGPGLEILVLPIIAAFTLAAAGFRWCGFHLADRQRRSACPTCHYDLTGSTVSTTLCPECGQTLTEQDLQRRMHEPPVLVAMLGAVLLVAAVAAACLGGFLLWLHTQGALGAA